MDTPHPLRQSMSGQTANQTIRVQELNGRVVRDARGKKLGRVYDVVAERDGNDLAVTGLLVGSGTWLSRFGESPRPHGRLISWEQIDAWGPEITVRDAEPKRGSS